MTRSLLLLQPQGHLKPTEALKLAQQAPTILRNNPNALSDSPLRFLFSSPESAETWAIYENLLLACLRTGDDTAAHECLGRLVRRFGDDNERIMALKGLMKESEAPNSGALDTVLKEYDVILAENSANIPIAKRRVVVLRSLDRWPDAIGALISLLEFTPTDAEAWSELSDMYLMQGLYPQAIYALEEVLVLTPNAWNMHARLGEVLLMAATATADDDGLQQYLAQSLKRFCRSIELCDGYLRGYYGLKLVSDRLMLSDAGKSTKRNDVDAVSLPDEKTVEKLNELATEKLTEIVQRRDANDFAWQGYADEEVAAARELLGKATTTTAGEDSSQA